MAGVERNGRGTDGCRVQIDTSIAQCVPASAGGIGPVRSAFSESMIVVEQWRGEVLAERRAQSGAGREHGIGIDVATNLARNVRLDRNGQRERDKGRFKLPVVKCRAERVE